MLGMMIAALLAATVAAAPPSTDPYEIFAQARRYWETQKYPGLLEYTVVVRVLEGGKERALHYRSAYDGYTGTVAFDPVSAEEAAHPHAPPKGFGFSFFFWRVTKPEPPVDYLGVPELAPNYGFGIGETPLALVPRTPTPAELVRQIREQFHDPDPRATATPTPEPTPGLHEIAAVFAKNRTYDVALVGTDRIDGAPAYHLALHPLREPHRYRLRDLWIDVATFAPRKLIEALNFTNGPGTAVPWSVTFEERDGALYIDRETALAPMQYRALVYTQASVSIEDLHPVEKLPRDLSDFEPVEPAGMLEEP
jgi:hypothetical protein